MVAEYLSARKDDCCLALCIMILIGVKKLTEIKGVHSQDFI